MKSTKPKTEHIWFSQFFGINLPQYALPFVDFDLESDVPLYIDPYAITKDPSQLGAKCHNAIASYFQCLLDAIRSQDKHGVRRLIHRRLTEPFEIHLGVSQVARRGRGIGIEQEQYIVDAITNSTAAKLGIIHGIQELELHIEGIGPDKISDLIANIILAHLAEFTEEMGDRYGIATQPVAISGFWNAARQEWDGGYFNLPINGINSYVLVPKRFVRRERDLMNHRQYYDKYVLEILQRELLDASDSLAQTLKSGKRRVTKKAIRADERFKPSKEFISNFITENPDSMDDYRSDLGTSFNPVDPAMYSGKANIDDPEIEIILEQLFQIPPGNKDAAAYHNAIFNLAEFIFDWVLDNFTKEFEVDQGRGRIDIIADNVASGGLFLDILNEFNAHNIPMECKNYRADMGNKEFNQLMERLGKTTSRFGVLFCRSIIDSTAMLKHQTDRWLRHNAIILLMDDAIVRQLAEYRLRRDFPSIDRLMRRMIRAVRYGSTEDGR